MMTEAECVKASQYDCISKFIDAPWLEHPFVTERFKDAWESATEAARMTFVRTHQQQLRKWSKAWEVACASYARSMLVKVLADNTWPTGVQHALRAAISAFDTDHAAYVSTL